MTATDGDEDVTVPLEFTRKAGMSAVSAMRRGKSAGSEGHPS